jgi:CshA-type fibril repeat protein
VTFTPLADADPAAPGDTLTVSLLDGSGSPVSTLHTDDGDYVVNGDGSITFTPADGFVGTPPVVPYQVSDSNGTTATATLTVNVAAIVGAPLANPAVGGAAALVIVTGLGIALLRRRRSHTG